VWMHKPTTNKRTSLQYQKTRLCRLSKVQTVPNSSVKQISEVHNLQDVLHSNQDTVTNYTMRTMMSISTLSKKLSREGVSHRIVAGVGCRDSHTVESALDLIALEQRLPRFALADSTFDHSDTDSDGSITDQIVNTMLDLVDDRKALIEGRIGGYIVRLFKARGIKFELKRDKQNNMVLSLPRKFFR